MKERWRMDDKWSVFGDVVVVLRASWHLDGERRCAPCAGVSPLNVITHHRLVLLSSFNYSHFSLPTL